jgi:carbamoyl-phosphate synthase large subunit
MGNPHCVVFVEETEQLNLLKIGPQIELNEKLFPERVNVEFVKVIDRTHIKMRVWERGSGETLACGTGACAAVVAAVENGLCDSGVPISVLLPGGKLIVEHTAERIFLTGPAATVFEGTVEL